MLVALLAGGAVTPARSALTAIALACALAAPVALAHEVVHEVVRGRAVAVHAAEADGEPLADAEFEVFSPADPAMAHVTGRTDRNGWLAFVPDAPGAWRVRVVEHAGHGLDTTVEVTAAGAAPADSGAPSALAFALRPALGVLLVVALFGALSLFLRRKRSPT